MLVVWQKFTEISEGFCCIGLQDTKYKQRHTSEDAKRYTVLTTSYLTTKDPVNCRQSVIVQHRLYQR
jgi:hypothetical protein